MDTLSLFKIRKHRAREGCLLSTSMRPCASTRVRYFQRCRIIVLVFGWSQVPGTITVLGSIVLLFCFSASLGQILLGETMKTWKWECWQHQSVQETERANSNVVPAPRVFPHWTVHDGSDDDDAAAVGLLAFWYIHYMRPQSIGCRSLLFQPVSFFSSQIFLPLFLCLWIQGSEEHRQKQVAVRYLTDLSPSCMSWHKGRILLSHPT